MNRIYLFIILTSFYFNIYSQSWEQVANFIGDGRHHPITFSNDNFGFVVAGSYLDDMYKYDPSNDTWTQLQDFPAVGRGYSYGVTVGNKAYMGLGSTDNGLYPNDWWEYDMDNDIWTQKSNFPGNGRNHPAMIVVGNKIYMGCGSNNNGNLGDWWEYDINTDSWTQKPDLPGNNRHHPFYFGIGNYAYVGFGHGSVSGPGSNPSTSSYIYNDFYRYDPSNDAWMQMNNFPSEARVAGTQLSYQGKGYVLSGDGDDHGPLDSGEFWEYDPNSDSWTQLSSHPGNAIWAPGNFVIGCNVYFLLGQDNTGFFPTTPVSVYKYKLNNDCGCTDPLAFNYSSLALIDDGSCCFISGCMDPLSVNYDSLACHDDGSCVPAIIGCMNPTASNFNPLANVTSFNGGAIDIGIGAGGYFYNDQHLIFNSLEQCIIKSADVYAENPNTVTFELRNSTGTVIDNVTHNLSPGKQTINLDFSVPVGNDLQLGLSPASNSGLYRNSTGSIYPYNIGDMISITGSSASQNGYYYFYYNIKVDAVCTDVTNLTDIDSPRRILKIVDMLGREVVEDTKSPIIYIYSDGSVEKKILIENNK
ncbi:MAG: hypothetical protein CMP51_00675 [Flavobacteriales bacterium]|nr:hypothetical protein [Flavobacteriales bacterium]|tara:strand:+ start:2439 stop:4190 length:1752 start_codon:yes stop_codon:yes gene_type:complete